MQLDKYKGVIRRVYEKSQGQSFEDFYDRLIDSLEIAAEIAGEVVSQNVSRETSPRRETSTPLIVPPAPLASKLTPASSSLIAAPPVADAEDEPEDDVDYWESKPGKGDGCRRMETKLNAVLPPSISVQPPGFDEPITLVRGVSGPGIKFVYVSYTLPGDSMGPRFTLMTSQKEINPQAIVEDCKKQAEASYSKEKRTIVPTGVKAQPLPSNQELQAILDRDRKSQGMMGGDSRDESTMKDAQYFGQSRANSPRWQ